MAPHNSVCKIGGLGGGGGGGGIGEDEVFPGVERIEVETSWMAAISDNIWADSILCRLVKVENTSCISVCCFEPLHIQCPL